MPNSRCLAPNETDASGNLQCSGRPSPCRSTASSDASWKSPAVEADLRHEIRVLDSLATIMLLCHVSIVEGRIMLDYYKTTSPAKLEAHAPDRQNHAMNKG